eukprot:scaffold205484_cov50-Prasinocladus_malaysianus.AAC.2
MGKVLLTLTRNQQANFTISCYSADILHEDQLTEWPFSYGHLSALQPKPKARSRCLSGSLDSSLAPKLCIWKV